LYIFFIKYFKFQEARGIPQGIRRDRWRVLPVGGLAGEQSDQGPESLICLYFNYL